MSAPDFDDDVNAAPIVVPDDLSSLFDTPPAAEEAAALPPPAAESAAPAGAAPARIPVQPGPLDRTGARDAHRPRDRSGAAAAASPAVVPVAGPEPDPLPAGEEIPRAVRVLAATQGLGRLRAVHRLARLGWTGWALRLAGSLLLCSLLIGLIPLWYLLFRHPNTNRRLGAVRYYRYDEGLVIGDGRSGFQLWRYAPGPVRAAAGRGPAGPGRRAAGASAVHAGLRRRPTAPADQPDRRLPGADPGGARRGGPAAAAGLSRLIHMRWRHCPRRPRAVTASAAGRPVRSGAFPTARGGGTLKGNRLLRTEPSCSERSTGSEGGRAKSEGHSTIGQNSGLTAARRIRRERRTGGRRLIRHGAQRPAAPERIPGAAGPRRSRAPRWSPPGGSGPAGRNGGGPQRPGRVPAATYRRTHTTRCTCVTGPLGRTPVGATSRDRGASVELPSNAPAGPAAARHRPVTGPG